MAATTHTILTDLGGYAAFVVIVAALTALGRVARRIGGGK